MGKLSPVYISSFTHACNLFLILLTAQYSRVSWAPICVTNSTMMQFTLPEFGNNILCCSALVSEAPVWAFQCVWMSI